jgi:phenylalanyl-tRNA synthetase alpha chain
MMLEQLDQIQETALSALAEVQDESSLEAWRVAHLGRSAALMGIFDQLGDLSKDKRPAIGQHANQVKRLLEAALGEKAEDLRQAALTRSLQAERLDVTLPGRSLRRGRLHPSTQTMRRMTHIFSEMGFQVFRSREVETDEFNFQLLNFPPHHPAREMQDSFYMAASNPENPLVLRTQTSPGQIHIMRGLSARNPKDPPPVRVILPGMVFRYEQTDATHEVQFNQLEGLALGQDITFGDLKGTLSDFSRRMFGQDVRARFRPSYFPFTEPSADLDIGCFMCGGKGCTVCGGNGWLEVLGCGMVHPTVLRNGGYDPHKYTGFAFGIGPERVAMLFHRVQDIRSFWANEMRFLEQF